MLAQEHGPVAAVPVASDAMTQHLAELLGIRDGEFALQVRGGGGFGPALAPVRDGAGLVSDHPGEVQVGASPGRDAFRQPFIVGGVPFLVRRVPRRYLDFAVLSRGWVLDAAGWHYPHDEFVGVSRGPWGRRRFAFDVEQSPTFQRAGAEVAPCSLQHPFGRLREVGADAAAPDPQEVAGRVFSERQRQHPLGGVGVQGRRDFQPCFLQGRVQSVRRCRYGGDVQLRHGFGSRRWRLVGL